MSPERSEHPEEPSKPELKLEGNDWVLPSDPQVLEQVRNEFASRLETAGLPNSTIGKLLIGFDEAVTNAIERGNLGVPGKRKGDPPDKHSQLIAQALQSDQARRRAYIHLDITPQEVIVTVRDEGNGFDVARLANPTAEEELAQLHEGGRGVFLMRELYDEVNYNERGNEVMLRHRRQTT